MPYRCSQERAAAPTIAAAVAFTFFLATLTTFALVTPARAAGFVASPDGQIVVVTANLRETVKDDVADTTDMQIFATRLLAQVPYAPDALLLQEVSRPAARNVASILSTRTGFRYTAVVTNSELHVETKNYVYNYGNAIVLNSTTMGKLDAGGYIGTTYSREDAAVSGKPSVSNTAYTLVAESSGGLQMSLASSHLAKQSALKTESIADAYKKEWVEKIATKLKSAYGVSSSRVSSMGGDYNDERCRNEARPCDPNPFWSTLTSSTYGYKDSVNTAGGVGGVDFIFTTGGVIDAGLDQAYPNDAKPGDVGFYSDHKFRWAHLGTDETPPTPPTNLRAMNLYESISLSWTAATDASGIDHYEVWKSGAAKWEPRLIGTTSLTRFVDGNVYRLKTYRYFVVAVDGSHNEARSNIEEIKADW